MLQEHIRLIPRVRVGLEQQFYVTDPLAAIVAYERVQTLFRIGIQSG